MRSVLWNTFIIICILLLIFGDLIVTDAEDKRGLFCLVDNPQVIWNLLASVKLLLSIFERQFTGQITSYWNTLEIRANTRLLQFVNCHRITFSNAPDSNSWMLALRILKHIINFSHYFLYIFFVIFNRHLFLQFYLLCYHVKYHVQRQEKFYKLFCLLFYLFVTIIHHDVKELFSFSLSSTIQ